MSQPTVPDRIIIFISEHEEEALKLFGVEKPAVFASWKKDPEKIPLAAGLAFLENEGAAASFNLNAEPDPDPKALVSREIMDAIPDVAELLAAADILRPRLRIDAKASVIDVLHAVSKGAWTRDIVLMIPFNRPVNPFVLFNIVALMRKNPHLGFQYKVNTVLQRARNLLCQEFLATEAQWALMMDSDMILPFSDPGFFQHKLKTQHNPEAFKLNVVDRLRSHPGKTIVGGVYAQRGMSRGLCVAPDITPRHAQDKAIVEKLKRGPFEELYPVDYVATGCAAVHRSVFLAIQAKFPDLAPKAEGEPWDFFGHNVGVSGEDMYFCKLAREAGHQPHLDCGLFCGHIGEYCFMP